MFHWLNLQIKQLSVFVRQRQDLMPYKVRTNFMTLTLTYMMKTPDICPSSQSLFSLQANAKKKNVLLLCPPEFALNEYSRNTHLPPCITPHHSFKIFLERNDFCSISYHVPFQSYDQRTSARSRAFRGPHTYLASPSPIAPHAELHLQGYTSSSYNPYFLPQTSLLKIFCLFWLCLMTRQNRVSSLYTWTLLFQDH